MLLNLKKEIATEIGLPKFKPFGLNPDTWGYGDTKSINLARLSSKQLAALEALFEQKRGFTRGVVILIADIRRWRDARGNAGGTKPRTVQQFSSLLTEYLLPVPGHRLFERVHEELWLCHYVNEVAYHRKQGHPYEHPAFVSMELQHHEFGSGTEKTISFYETDCRAKTVVEALAAKGFYIETPELRAQYLEEMKLMNTYAPQIGTQFLATGFGLDDCDGNPEGRDSSWYWHQTHEHELLRNGEPSRVVVDVFFENAREERREQRGDNVQPSQWFWHNAKKGRVVDDDADDVDDDADADDATMTEIEVPVHPWLAVFDFVKHLRLRVHVRQLTPYRYDKTLVDRLVISDERKRLVKLLVEMRGGGFVDIVKGKSGGAVVLLTGPPGTGKTLTAEVYAETEGRALYSVQCSQLGTDPDVLEDSLLKVFARARRWNAVLLLDEADVYVHERGDDLTQNAIVGVFLRVLEYQSSVLFLTTNRPEDVDDAIASRCIARLHYDVPTIAQQHRLWQVLSDTTGVKLATMERQRIVDANPELTGRDVKNLLKLARLVSKNGITADAVEFVKQFKPTGSEREHDAVAALRAARAELPSVMTLDQRVSFQTLNRLLAAVDSTLAR